MHTEATLSRSPEARIEAVEDQIRHQPEIIGFQSYESFGNNNAQQKADFIAGNGNLSLHYSGLQEAGVEQLAKLAKEGTEKSLILLLGSEPDKRVNALFDSIEYRQSEIFLVYMAARMNNTALSLEERREAAEWFKLSNENLYGVADPKLFGAIARDHLMPGLQASYEANSTEHHIQQELRGLIGTIVDEGYERKKASLEAKERFANLVRERFDGMVAHVTPHHETIDGEQVEKKYTVPEIAEAITIALEKIGAADLGWRCEIVEGKNLLGTSPHRKIVEVGADRTPISAQSLQGKIVHEVGVHALRSVLAEKAGWISAAYGQAGYLAFEEALATVMGNVYAQDKAVPGPEYRYLVAGFAEGYDGRGPRDIRDCYEIMWRTIYLDRQQRHKKADLNAVKNTAFLQCLRMYRSTPTDIPGLIYSKDLSYANGEELINPVIELVRTQKDIDLLLCGKLDLTRPDQLDIAEDMVPDAPLITKLREQFELAA